MWLSPTPSHNNIVHFHLWILQRCRAIMLVHVLTRTRTVAAQVIIASRQLLMHE